MQKISQKRSLLNKLREMTDIGGTATEKYFSPEFGQIMDQLRKVDDGMRAIASGEQVGDASPPADAISLKDLLKSVKSNLNRREYMKAVADLGRFHRKMFDIVHLLTLLENNVDKIHEKFLFQDLDDESKKYLQSFRSRWATIQKTYFIKEANILDFFTNIGTERGRALAAWEKRYPNKVKKLRDDSVALLSLSEKLLNILLSSLKDMAKARASRNPDNYITISKKIINAFKNYDTGESGFKKFYENNVKGFLEKQEFFAPTKIDITEKPEDLGKKEVEVQSIRPSPEGEDVTKTIVEKPVIPKLPPVPQMPTAPLQEELKPTSMSPSTDLDDETKATQVGMKSISHSISPVHRKFVESLQSMEEESTILLAAHISRYAKSILSSDPHTALKLFNIVKYIKG